MVRTVCFQVADVSTGDRPFIIALSDPSKIAHARAILSGSEKERIHVRGTIIKALADYNTDWPYHIDPQTIDFFAFAIEVCDASAEWVEENLDEIGGAALPNCHWCPWSSELVGEVGPI